MISKVLSLLLLLSFCQPQSDQEILVGTYTRNTDSEGIYYLKLNSKGKVKELKLLAESDNPSYLSMSADGRFVYAVNEHGDDSEVSAFRFDRENLKLEFINKVSAAGADPCFITTSEKHVFIANYSSGSIAVFERQANGSLSEAVQVDEHRRMHFGNNRFGPSNAHQIIFSPDGNYLYATNLGTDRVITYRYNPNSKTAVLVNEHETSVKKASGPRHMVLNADGNYMYLVHELDATLSVLAKNNNNEFEVIQETTLVTDPAKTNGAADIHISANGKYLYATNRGNNNDITIFRINEDHSINFVKNYTSGGDGPRNFIITSDNKHLIVANQHSNNIAVYNVKKKGKKLKLINKAIDLGAPVCLVQL